MTSKDARYGEIRKILLLILALNWSVALVKIIFGLCSRTSSITADGFHSLSDGASNVIGLIGITFAAQPKDLDHPYGHKKYETLFSLGIAAALFLVCFNLVKEGIQRIYHPVIPEVGPKSFLVMLMTLGINLWVAHYEARKGKALGSDILLSDAMHTKADIFTSLSVIIALVVIRLGYPILDPIATLLITLFIAHAAVVIIKNSSRVLVDSAAIVDTKKIVDIVLSVKGVKTCHKIRSRGRPDDIHLDLHVQVAPEMHIDRAHKICYCIEEAIKQGMPEVTDVLIHIEPKERNPAARSG
ncbi:MAG: cation diffusion facilitator family transporter [Candidatus Omnitrophica bacterium]|nr:cation diffusion facilitator family transporter [Candidatus Omnitrophota bacterium]